MRILQVVNAFYPAFGYGGSVKVAYDLSRQLVQSGHNVTVFTTDTVNANMRQNARYLEIEGVKVFYFKNISNTLAWRRYFFPPEMISQLKAQIKTFDIVHIHGFRHFPSVFVHHYAKKYGIPYVLQPHGSLPRIIEKQKLKRLYDWVEIIPNGIDLSEYENLPKKGEFRKKYGIGNNEKIILYLGRIHKTKGIDLLIGAYADLIKHLDNVRLVIVGPDDGFLSTLKRQIEDLEIGDRILFTGPLHESDKLGAYVDVDVFVTPSFLGFPVTFLEACACGTPIITTRNGDELDWIHDRVGYVVEYNKEQLQDAMSKILSDEGLMRRFGEEGKRLVRNEFGWDKVVKKIEKFYEDCIVCNTPKV